MRKSLVTQENAQFTNYKNVLFAQIPFVVVLNDVDKIIATLRLNIIRSQEVKQTKITYIIEVVIQSSSRSIEYCVH